MTDAHRTKEQEVYEARSACEKCWRDASSSEDKAERYLELLKERGSKPCTAEEQAGPDAGWCPDCGRMVLHQHTGECMAGCSSEYDEHERGAQETGAGT